MEQEFIVCAAIWYQDGKEYVHQPRNIKTGLVISGLRHCHALTTRCETHLNRDVPEIQGFITNTHRFVDRKEARRIAITAGQVKTTIHNTDLFSEDIY